MEIFKKLGPINFSDEELNVLVDKVKNRDLECHNMVDIDGDFRFWNVAFSQSYILEEFYKLAGSCYFEKSGNNPKHIILMINHLNPERTLDGSGGGWHVDSVANQYKLFMYLEDCLDVSNGPLTLLSYGVSWVDKLVIGLNYIVKLPFGKKFRFSEKLVRLLTKVGFSKISILEKKANPFFVNTSYIHRGLPISKGERLMITAYIFSDDVPASIAKRIYE